MKRNLTLDQRIDCAIRTTYEAISSDLYAIDDDFNLDSAVECTLDADRVLTFGEDIEAARSLYSLSSWKEMEAVGRRALREYF